MPVVRVFRGREVERTCRVGGGIVVVYRGTRTGVPGERVVVPPAEYPAGVRVTRRAPGPPGG